MARISKPIFLGATLLIAFAVSGCQMPGGKWSTAWKERSKPKPNFRGVDELDQVASVPKNSSKNKSKMTEMPAQLKERLAAKTDRLNHDGQLDDLIKEGDQLRRNGQLEESRLAYNKALLLSPDNPYVHHRLAIVADKMNQYSVADDHYHAALQVRPRDPDLLSDLGYSYGLRGNTQQAEATLKQALAISKSHKGAMSNLGALYAQQNRPAEAMEMFRNGASEADAQQYMARLFSQGNSGPANPVMADRGMSTGGYGKGRETPADLSKMSFDEIQREMAKLRQEAKMRRQIADQKMLEQSRNFDLDDLDSPSVATQNPRAARGNPNGSPIVLGPQDAETSRMIMNPNGMAPEQSQLTQMQPGIMNAMNSNVPTANLQNSTISPSNSRTNNSMWNDQNMAESTNPQPAKIYRGRGSASQPNRQNDPQIQQAWDQQMPNSQGNQIQRLSASNSTSQMATQLGMNAGPGSMFPVVADAANLGSNPEMTDPRASASPNDNRFGGEYQQATNYKNPPNLPGNRNDQTSTMATDGKTEQSTVPMSPLSNWSSPSSGTLNWQNDSAKATNWSNDPQTLNNSQTLNNFWSAGTYDPSSTAWGEQQNRDTDTQNPPQRFMNGNGSRTDSDASTFEGAWPKTTTIPIQQDQNQTMTKTFEMQVTPSGNQNSRSTNQNRRSTSSGRNGAMSNPSNSMGDSLPQYPFAPNR